MDVREQLIGARGALQKAVDRALEEMPEYKALQRVEEALAALDATSPGGERPTEPDQFDRSNLSYANLAIQALRHTGQPMTTPEIIGYIARFRQIASDPEKAKINVSSALSKEEGLVNLAWKGGRAWWLRREQIPKRELDSMVTP